MKYGAGNFVRCSGLLSIPEFLTFTQIRSVHTENPQTALLALHPEFHGGPEPHDKFSRACTHRR